MYGYQYVLYNNMKFTGYHLSYNGAAGKAFSAYMPTYITFFWLTKWSKIEHAHSPAGIVCLFYCMRDKLFCLFY
jgi:hypothetical protein